MDSDLHFNSHIDSVTKFVTKQAICCCAINSWDKLPEDLRLAPTRTTFKTRLKTFVCFSFLLNLKYIALSTMHFFTFPLFVLTYPFYYYSLLTLFGGMYRIDFLFTSDSVDRVGKPRNGFLEDSPCTNVWCRLLR